MLELGRAFVTGSEYDVQFDDLAGTYHTEVAIFDNAQTCLVTGSSSSRP